MPSICYQGLGGWVPEPEDDDDDDDEARGFAQAEDEEGYSDIGEDDVDESDTEDGQNELAALTPEDLAQRQQLLRSFKGRKDWDLRPHVHTAGTNW